MAEVAVELIVALDGPNPAYLASQLEHDLGLLWFKIGPQAMMSPDWTPLIDSARRGAKLFLDLKLADTKDTCYEAARRFAQAGIAALSTFTDDATDAALSGAAGYDLQIWRVAWLTDARMAPVEESRCGHGAICPVPAALLYQRIKTICPGIRLNGERNGHLVAATPQQAKYAGASFVVVGRPIWQADDPVSEARRFMKDLASPSLPETPEL